MTMKLYLLPLFIASFLTARWSDHGTGKKKTIVVWQPSHQTDTGKDFSEAAVCNAIAEAAMETKPFFKEYKVWSLGHVELHHADSGSNTMVRHTTEVIDGKKSG